MGNSKKVIVRNLGSVDFEESFKIQKQIQNEIIDIKLNNRKNNLNLPTPNYLLFMEHNHVYTLGNSGDDKNLLFNEKELDKKGIKFIKTNRGGDITYHGPGQLVCYPIFDLENFYTDIHRYLRDLEEIIVGTLDHFGIVAFWNPNETGVWLDIGSKNERKICAMGIKVSRWVTMHGLALNVNTDLSYFEGIIPCGINNKGVTSINNELSQKVDLKKVREIMIKNFEKKFNVIIDS